MMDRCVVCHDPSLRFRPYWLGLKQCLSCGHVTADLNASEVRPERIYSEAYFSGEEYVDYRRDRVSLERQFRSRLADVKRYQTGGALVEVGCAYGFFLNVARSNFRVTGFDIAEKPVAYAREQLGLEAVRKDFIDAPLEPDSIDVVAMWDTIEHLPRPDVTIEKASRVLRSGGHIFVTTGDIGSRLAQSQREKWRMIHPPSHLHYFSRQTLSRMLSNYGLRAVSIRYVGARRSVRQVAYSLLQLGKPVRSRLFALIDSSKLADLSFSLNTYDIMELIARKD